MDKASQLALVERAKALGWSLKYKYDGHALHSVFRDNDHQWVLFHNWGALSYRTLKDVARAVEGMENLDKAKRDVRDYKPDWSKIATSDESAVLPDNSGAQHAKE